MQHRRDHNRRQPARLSPEDYQRPGQMVFMHFRCRGASRLTEDDVAPILVRALADMATRFGVTIHAYCVMPDHMHVVASVTVEGGDLAKWLRYGKRESARRLGFDNMWQRSYWDRNFRHDDAPEQAVLYTLNNPVRRSLCERVSDWPFSWSEWHPETKGPPAR